MILFIKNISIEGPGTLQDFLITQGFETKTVDLSIGETLPIDFRNLQAVICLGGPMNVDEEEKYPFLKDENIFIKEVLKREIPFLGICLGAQLLAKACNAKVVKSPDKEIGFSYVTLSAAAKNDPLFLGVKSPLDVFQWHEDMFQVPKKAILLASSPACPHQAFHLRKSAYGIQFHVEVTKSDIVTWMDTYFFKEDSSSQARREKILLSYSLKEAKLQQLAWQLYENFIKIVQKRREAVANRISAN